MLLDWLPFALGLTLAAAQQQGLIAALKSSPELSQFTAYLVDEVPDLALWLQGKSDITILAPSDDAIANLADLHYIANLPSTDENPEDFFAYFVLDGTFASFNSDEYIIIPTVSRPDFYSYSNVTGGQVVVAKGSPGSLNVTFTSGRKHVSTSVDAPLRFAGGFIYTVDSLLISPGTFTDTIVEEDKVPEGDMPSGPAFATALVSVPGTVNNVTIDHLSDVTVFLPLTISLQEIGNLIQDMSVAEFNRLVSYHVIDMVLDINADAPPSGDYVTYEGSSVTIFSHNGKTFVNNAQIIGLPNWIFQGGMIYGIDGVLNPDNTTVDPNIDGPEIAFAGAKYTPDFTFPSEPALPSTPISSPAPSSNSNGLSGGAKAGIGIAAAVTFAILFGIFIFWRQRRQAIAELGPDPKHQDPPAYMMKDLEASESHERLATNAARPARDHSRDPAKQATPSLAESLSPSIKGTSDWV